MLLLGGLFVCAGDEPRGGHAAGPVRAGASLRVVIGDPAADCEFDHLALALRTHETEGGIQSIGRLLVVLEHKVSPHGGHRHRETYAQTPARDIDFVDSLVADFTVAGVPNPMPIVVKAIAGKRLQRRGAGPQVVVNAGGNGLLGGAADRWPPLVANPPGHVNAADRAPAQMPNGLPPPRCPPRPPPVPPNSLFLLYPPP